MPVKTPEALNQSGHTEASPLTAGASFSATSSGTTPTYAGSVRLKAGTFTFKAHIGCVNTAHAATAKLYRSSTGDLIASIGGSAGGLTNRQVSNVTIPAEDWYEITLETNNSDGVGLLRGVSWE